MSNNHATLFLLSTAALAGPPTNFRHHEFNGPACSMESDLVLAKEEGEGIGRLAIYREIEPNMAIGPVALTDLVYACWQDKLMMVSIEFPADGAMLLSILTKSWGAPRQPNQFLDEYLWSGLMFSVLNYSSHGGVLTFSHSGYMSEWRAAREKAASEAAESDL